MEAESCTQNPQKVEITAADAKAAVVAWAETNGGPPVAVAELQMNFGVKLKDIGEEQAAAIHAHFTDPANVARIEEVKQQAGRDETATEADIPAHLRNLPREMTDSPRWTWGCPEDFEQDPLTLAELAKIPSNDRPAYFVCGDGWLVVRTKDCEHGERLEWFRKLSLAIQWKFHFRESVKSPDLFMYCVDQREASNRCSILRETQHFEVWGAGNWVQFGDRIDIDSGLPIDASQPLRELLDSDSTPAQLFAAKFREVPKPREAVELIPGVLRQGENLIIGGVAKSHKTAVLADMAVSLADGGDFLSYFPVKQRCPVLFVSCETKQPTFETMLRAMRATKAVEDMGRLHVRYLTPNLQDPDNAAAIAEFANDIGAGAIVFDPASKILRGLDNASNLFSTSAALAPLDRIEELTGATIILAHHLRSLGQDRFRKPDLRDLSQAGFSEWARQWVLLNHSQEYRPGLANLWMQCGHAMSAATYRVSIDCGRMPWTEYAVAVVDDNAPALGVCATGGDADSDAVVACLDDVFRSAEAIRKVAKRSYARTKLALEMAVQRGDAERGPTQRGAEGYRLRQGETTTKHDQGQPNNDQGLTTNNDQTRPTAFVGVTVG